MTASVISVENLLAKIAPSVLNKIATSLSRPVDDIKVRLLDLFGEHLRFTVDRCSTVKTIVSDERPVDLRSIYVNLQLRDGDDIIDDYNLASRDKKKNRYIIKGTAGAGKTMLMRYLALETYANSGKLPIFIDLRDIADPREKSFLKSVFEICTPQGSGKGYELFNAGLRAGLFSFFFDGLDEISPEHRDQTFRQMQRFPFEFPNIEVAISSRPETETSAFSIFPVLYLLKLDLDRAVALLDKTHYHDELKKAAFIDNLKRSLFVERESFASNPLLCLLMLMTFGDYADVPQRAALFYDQAFETLYQRHDSSKGPFRRKYKSGLQKDEFKKALRLFCYRSLASHQISFSSIEISRELKRSLEINELAATSDDLLHDVLESVCLMHRDGGKIHFIHRSFQEFFAADFLANYRGPSTFDVFDRILSDPLGSRVPALLYDIDQPLIEELWIEPILLKLKSSLDGLSDIDCLKRFFTRVLIADDSGLLIAAGWDDDKNLAHILNILAEIYGLEVVPYDHISPFGANMVPKQYNTIREFISRDPAAPRKLKDRLKAEKEAIYQANKERKSMTVHKVTVWEVDFDQNSEAWFAESELLQRVPLAKQTVEKLHSEVSNRVNTRRRIDILS